MKIASMVLVMCLVGVLAFGDSSGEIVSIDIDSNGNIRVWTQYKVDGVEVDSRYPKIDGKQVYCVRYNKKNFLGMSKAEITERIEQDLQSHSRNLIAKEFDKNAPKTLKQIRVEYNTQANQDFMDISFPVLVGRKVAETESVIILDTDNDGVQDKEIKVTSDGKKTITDITP